ncbi:unnamed protein product [Zymoseptoria tritici ST99CH_3D1]|nr:unnamed protein product [Zymoseptoria tritici ST99CH_3D1]
MQPEYPPNWPLQSPSTMPLKPSLIPRGSHHCREDDMSMFCYLKHVLNMSNDDLVHEWLRRRDLGMRRARMAAMCEWSVERLFTSRWSFADDLLRTQAKQSLARRWAALSLEVLEHGLPDDPDDEYDSFSEEDDDDEDEDERDAATATATSSISDDESDPPPISSTGPLQRMERLEGDALKWFWAQDVSDDKKFEGLIGRDVEEYWDGENSEAEEEEEDDNEDHEYDVVGQRVAAAAHARALYLAWEVGSGDVAGDLAYDSAMEE